MDGRIPTATDRDLTVAADAPVSPAAPYGSDSLLQVVDRLTACVLDATDADAVAVLLLDEDAGTLAWSRLATRSEIGAPVLAGSSRPPMAIDRVDGAAERPWIFDDLHAGGGFPTEWSDDVEVASAVVAPIEADGSLLGLLAAGWTRPAAPARRHGDVLTRFAETIALTLRAAVTAAVEHAFAAERDRVADETAAVLGRTLAAVNLRSGLIRLTGDEDVAGEAVDIESMARRGLTALRRAQAARATLQVSGVDLVGALHELVREFEERHLVEAEFAAGPLDDVPDSVREALLVTAAEALSNVERHARASVLEVQVGVVDDAVVMRVSDDGVGADRVSPDRLGVGLEIARTALDAVGGRVVVADTGRGTDLVARVPLRVAG